ncbi:MAG: hypothetical protein JRG94_11290 [Deltaproteobacteria bacterium]|nr:hypothetical protein [Deltaproteobacteria bacterium]
MNRAGLIFVQLFAFVAIACVGTVEPTSTERLDSPEGRASLSEIEVLEPAHFPSPKSGETTLLEMGAYAVDAADESTLRLLSHDGREFHIAAVAGKHGSVINKPVAEERYGEADEMHILLFRPDGSLLDATGSFSGIMSRRGSSLKTAYSVRQRTLVQMGRSSAEDNAEKKAAKNTELNAEDLGSGHTLGTLEAVNPPDLSITYAELGCTMVGRSSYTSFTRTVFANCDTRHQVELRLVIKNNGANDVFFNGEIWDTQSALALLRAAPAGQSRLTYPEPIPPMQAGQQIEISSPPQPAPVSRNIQIQAGGTFTETVVLTGTSSMPVGSHQLIVRVDPQGVLAETNEGNNERSLTLNVAVPPLPDHEWVTCSRPEGVSVRIRPRRTSEGNVSCNYYERYSERFSGSVTISSDSGRPYTGCLLKNSDYPQESGNTSMYCSFTKSQEQLVRGAIEWADPAPNLKLVEFGSRNAGDSEADAEPFNICRARYGNRMFIGRGWRGRCYFPAGRREIRRDTGFQYMVLSEGYGIPTEISQRWSPIASPVTIRKFNSRVPFCLMRALFNSIPGIFLTTENAIHLALPGLLYPNGTCKSSAQGEPYTQSGGNWSSLGLK